MATPNPAVFDQLFQMGLDVPIVHEAARRFSDVERAVNWAFDHGLTWLNDHNVASAGDFTGNATGLDYMDTGPPQQQTHNNSPNVSPLIAAQAGTGMDVDDLRKVDMTDLNVEPAQSSASAPSVNEDPTVYRNSLDTTSLPHHPKTYGKKASKTPSSDLGLAAGQSSQKLGSVHRQLPPPPPLESFNGPLEESEEDQIQRAIRLSLSAAEVMETDPPTYNEADPTRRLRASAPPPEFPAAESTSHIELGSNNPFRNAAGLSNERSVTFAKVPDETIDQGFKSLVAVAPSADSVSGIKGLLNLITMNPGLKDCRCYAGCTSRKTNPRALTVQEQEDADLQAALNASLSENQAGGFPMTTSTTDTANGTSGAMEGVDDLDLDPDSKVLFDEGQQGVPIRQEEA
ncbi:hypothetical protein QFC19_005822 [Naganishia cerealis]|uniref:Uncharacterized protein n=1 Tax=Naganishia cerealis TaxID=610337 RepID=A0ACC2VLX5_9TREE|nr:hypothetical protein QFC19_005822 [Naganishia cerealis]